jgi:adenosylmethionine-8-amino-7-oxononanoate aminotransferase
MFCLSHEAALKPRPAMTDDPHEKRPHLWRPYTQMKTAAPALEVVSAGGVRLRLADGRELIDGVANWWTACHGHRHPHIVAAVEDQLRRLPHAMLGGLTHEPAERLAARLAALAPGDLDHVFFCESGSVSVEIAMKMAAQFWINQGQRGRTSFISFRGGYHGDTFATMSVCDPEEGMHALFKGVIPEQIIADLPVDDASAAAFEALLAREAGRAAAVLMEPLAQGAGGMRFHSAETVRRVRAACDRHGVLLIFDEIMTGFGRLGAMFAADECGVTPDIMTVSKALTGGTLPLAAAIASRRVFDAFWSDSPEAALMHGPTYMGNPLACAAANASLDLFEREPRLEQARALEDALTAALAPAWKFPGVVDVRAQGAISVIQMRALPNLDDLKARLVENGVWVRPFRDIIYLTPPLLIGPDDLAALARATLGATRDWAQANFA